MNNKIENKHPILDILKKNHEKEPIDIAKIQNVARCGLYDVQDVERAYTWLILTRSFPKYYHEWPSYSKEIVEAYRHILKKTEGLDGYAFKQIPSNEDIEDFGLIHNDQMAIIHGDIIRSTHRIYWLPIIERNPDVSCDPLCLYHEHLRRMERVLYIFSLQKNLGYIQGYSELAFPFYYVFLCGFAKGKHMSDDDSRLLSEDDLDLVEALTFHSLNNLVAGTQLRDMYKMDKYAGVEGLTRLFLLLVRKHVPVVADAIDQYSIHPFFSMKWFSIMFGQNADLPTLCTLWDVIFSNFDNLLQFLFYIGVAAIKQIGDIPEVHDRVLFLSLLQNPRLDTNLKEIVNEAQRLYDEDMMDQEKKKKHM